MLVVIKLAEDATSQINAGASDAPAGEINAAVRSVTGTDLRPMSSTGSLRSFFWVDVPDAETAGQLIRHLRELRGVEAAYGKPSDESP